MGMMGKLKIGGREHDPNAIIRCVEFRKIFATLFLKRSLTPSEFELTRFALSQNCILAETREFLLQLNSHQAEIASAVSDLAYREMEQRYLLGLQGDVATPHVRVMWPEEFATIETNTLLCLQDESALVRPPSQIRWLGTNGLAQTIVWYIFNEDMSFLLNISLDTLNFEANVRQSIVGNLPIGTRRPMNVMLLGGLADRNNALIMSLYHLALLARDRGYEFNITCQATLDRNLHPLRIPPLQWSTCDEEFMRMTTYVALKEKMILAYKTFCPEASLDLLHKALDIPHDKVMTNKVGHAPLTLLQLEQLVKYLRGFSAFPQKHNFELVLALKQHCPIEMAAEPVERQEGLLLLFQMILSSTNTLTIYCQQCAEASYTSKFSVFIVELASQRISLLAPHTLGIAQSLRDPLFTTPPNPAASFLRHIKTDCDYRIFLPLRAIAPYWMDADKRTTTLRALRDTQDPSLSVRVHQQHDYPSDPVHKEYIIEQIFKFCLHLSTVTSAGPLALLRAALFSRHDLNAARPTHLELLTLTYMYLLLAGLPTQKNTVEVHRRNAPHSNIVDATIASTPDAEQEVSDRLSRSGMAVHYQISLAENEAHCLYVENAHLPALRFFWPYLVPQPQSSPPDENRDHLGL